MKIEISDREYYVMIIALKDASYYFDAFHYPESKELDLLIEKIENMNI